MTATVNRNGSQSQGEMVQVPRAKLEEIIQRLTDLERRLEQRDRSRKT